MCVSYGEDLNGRRSDKDYFPHMDSVGERPKKGVYGGQSHLIALALDASSCGIARLFRS
jgi:hypothetical protein